MLLSLWFDFWNTADWTGGPTPPPAAPQSQQLGGPEHRRKRREHYVRADDEFWVEYEKMLRRVHATPVAADAPQPVKVLARRREALVVKAKAMPTIGDLLEVDSKISALTLQIEEFNVKSRDEEEALLALLL